MSLGCTRLIPTWYDGGYPVMTAGSMTRFVAGSASEGQGLRLFSKVDGARGQAPSAAQDTSSLPERWGGQQVACYPGVRSVSVIVPARDRARLIGPCLESLCRSAAALE